MRAAILLGALAACSFPTKTFSNGAADAPQGDAPPGTPDGPAIDAPPGTPDADLADAGPVFPDGGGFNCVNAPLPTTAPPTITLSGVVQDATQQSLATTVTLSVVDRSDPTMVLGQMPVSGTGNFQFQLQTGGVPLDVRFHVQSSQYAETWFYPPVPFAGNDHVGVLVFQSSELPLFEQQCDNSAPTPGDGTLFITTTDCAGTPVAGATVGFGRPLKYYNSTTGMCGGGSTDTSGIVFGFDVPAQPITLTGTVGGTAARANSFTVTANALIETILE